ncbi:hypothetical protein EGW08_012335 [Elysia chlorotica]|uniref:Uncharacterized protein n=1 Tax=Elysia chlorotica TaxID=188477 RepID=A0A433TEB1_ELYCH|nr:hypothetical protein EGW08_012335 [Elysia chlorotica]
MKSSPSAKLPTKDPGIMPTKDPGIMPTKDPGIMPTKDPGIMPTKDPRIMPTDYPTNMFSNYHNYPSVYPTQLPGIMPTKVPGIMPSDYPETMPSDYPHVPTMMPSQAPPINPTKVPGITPSQKVGSPKIQASPSVPSMSTPHAGQHQGLSFTNILSIAEFQEARRLPPTSCVQSLDYERSSSALLDTRDKLTAFGRSLQGDELTLFQRLRSSPDYDLSIFTGETLHDALEQLLNMGSRERDVFFDSRGFLADPTNFQDYDFLERVMLSWTPKIRLLQTKDAMCEIQSMVPYELLGELCDHLQDEETSAIETTLFNERCADCTALLVFERWDGNHTGILQGIKGKILYAKLRQMRADWDIFMLRFSPKAVESTDIDRIALNNFFDDIQLSVLADEFIQQQLSSQVKRRLALKLEEAHGPFPTWSSDLHHYLGHYTMFLPPDELDTKLDPTMIIEMEIMPEEIRSKNSWIQKFYSILAWKAAEWLSDPLNIPTEFAQASIDVKAKYFCIITKYAALPHLYGTVFDSRIITHGMSECRRFDIDYSKMDFLVDVVSSDPGLQWTANVMVDLDPLMPAVPASVLRNISAMELKAYWEEKDAEFPISSARTVWEQIKHTVDLSTMDCHGMMTAREGLMVFSPDELKLIPLHVFTECAPIFSHYLDERCEHNPRGCEMIWKLIKQSASFMQVNLATVMKNMTKEFIYGYVPPEDMNGLMTRDDKDLEEILQIPLDDIHASVIFRKIEQELGNFSLMDMEHHNVTDKDAYRKLFSMGSTVKTVYNKVKETLQMDTRGRTDVCLDETMTEDLAPFFTQASESDLKKLSPDSREKILKAIGSASFNSEDEEEHPGECVEGMTRNKLNKFLEVQLKTKELDQKPQLTSQDVEEVGPYLFCGMGQTVEKKLSDDAVREYLDVFESCVQLAQIVREALAERVINLAGGVTGLMDKPSMVKDLGTMLAYVDPDDLDRLDEASNKGLAKKLEKFEIHMTDMMSQGIDRSTIVKSKCDADIPTEEISKEESMRSDLLERIFVKKQPVSGKVPLDSLSDFQKAPLKSFLNASDIREMKIEEFEDCLEDLQKPEWDDSQLDAIGSKLKDLFGNSTLRWKPDDPMKAGNLIRALPKDDLLDITFNEDILAVLGQMEMKANESAEILNKFARDKGMPDLSSATADELASMGKLVCSMDPRVISRMAADSVSFLTKIFLSTTGGASKEALKSLDEEQLANVNPKAISKVPAKTFSEAFSADKLAQLSDAQALYLTPSHMWRMSTEQREAMSNFTQNAGINVPTASHGNKISEKSEFVGAWELPRVSCGNGMALAGQRDRLLDSPNKVDTYRRLCPRASGTCLTAWRKARVSWIGTL